jgi:hypothetical protein
MLTMYWFGVLYLFPDYCYHWMNHYLLLDVFLQVLLEISVTSCDQDLEKERQYR